MQPTPEGSDVEATRLVPGRTPARRPISEQRSGDPSAATPAQPGLDPDTTAELAPVPSRPVGPGYQAPGYGAPGAGAPGYGGGPAYGPRGPASGGYPAPGYGGGPAYRGGAPASGGYLAPGYGVGPAYGGGAPASGIGPMSTGTGRTRDCALPPAHPATVAVSVLWRAVVAGLAIWCVTLPLTDAYLSGGTDGLLDQLTYFTTITAGMVALTMTLSVLRVLLPGDARQRLEGRVGWFRGMVTTYALMTGLVFNFLMEGSTGTTLSMVGHVVLPAAMVVDWLVVGRNQGRVGWYWPILWLVPMLGYLALYYQDAIDEGYAMYAFLDPARDDFWTMVGILLVAWFAAGMVLWGIGRVRERMLGGGRPRA